MHTPAAWETRTVGAPATQEQCEGGSEHRLAATFRRQARTDPEWESDQNRHPQHCPGHAARDESRRRARRSVWERNSGAELRYPVERDRELRRLPLPINRECIGVAAATASQME